MSTRRLVLIAVTLLATALPARGAAPADTLLVWVDDAHTRQIEVRELDPDEIADPSSFGLGLGARVTGLLGVSIGWSRERGVQYDELAEQLIEQLRELCEEFNDGELSLETYQRRLRQIHASIGRAQVASVELRAAVAIQMAEAGGRLDEVLGIRPSDVEAYKRDVESALEAFRGGVVALPEPTAPAARAPSLVSTDPRPTLETSRAAVDARLAELAERVAADPSDAAGDVELIEVWADRARTRRIAVPRLDTEQLTQAFEDSLCIRVTYSTPVFSRCFGPEATWSLERSAEYEEAAQVLVVKYRRLCVEYNAGLLCQEEYGERLLELFEAERCASSAREALAQRLNARIDALRAELGDKLGSAPSETETALARLARERGARGRRQLDGPDVGSRLDALSREHRADMAAWEEFSAGVEAFQVQLPDDAIEVWVDEARTRRIRAPRLDTQLIADSIVTRLSLQICVFDFGPELSWAQRTGMEYDELAQLLIVKSKQLCMDYNAGLVSQEGYERRRRAIDAALGQATSVRERMADFAQSFRRSALERLDRRLELERGRGDG